MARKTPYVYNLNSPRTGTPVANQFIIEMAGAGEYFQSYRTVIAFKWTDGRIILDKDSWDYSKTTLKYLKQFLFNNHAHLYSKKEIQARIDDGTYKVANLN